MKSKPQSSSGLGDFLLPITELLGILLITGIDYLIRFFGLSVNALMSLIFKSKDPKKIKRDSIWKTSTTNHEEHIGVSLTKRSPVHSKDINKTIHTAVVGASGSGKSNLLDALMFDDLKKGLPVVFIDPKGDNKSLETFIALCKLCGREFSIFSEYYKGEGSVSINPVKDGSATNIADRIHHSFTWSEEHYERLCYNALKEAITDLLHEREIISIAKVYNRLLEISNPKDKDSRLADRKNIQGILSRLKSIIESDFGKSLSSTNALSFCEIKESKKCVYIGLSVLGYAEIARALGKIFIGDISYSVYKTYKSLNHESIVEPIAIYIDELGAVITDEFIELLNKCRGAAMQLTFAFQCPSDIAKHDPHLLIQILENSSNWFVFKQRMEADAEIFSEAIGTVATKKKTVRMEDGRELDMGSLREVEELVAHHNVIKNLNVGQCILLRHNPTRVDLLNVKYMDPNVIQQNLKTLLGQKIITNKVSEELTTNEPLIEKTINKGLFS